MSADNGWNLTAQDAGKMEIDEVFDTDHWLDGWIGRDGSRPAFERIPLLANELLPRGALDGAEPDGQWLREATGNEGITLQRAYRRAALVVWPRAKTLEVMASAGVGRAVAWLAEEHRRAAGTGDPVEALVSRLIDIWPVDDIGPGGMDRAERIHPFGELGDEDEVPSAEWVRAGMLRLLATVGDASLGVRFLDRVVRTLHAHAAGVGAGSAGARDAAARGRKRTRTTASGRGRAGWTGLRSPVCGKRSRRRRFPGYRDTTSSTPATTTAEQLSDQKVSVSPASR